MLVGKRGPIPTHFPFHMGVITMWHNGQESKSATIFMTDVDHALDTCQWGPCLMFDCIKSTLINGGHVLNTAPS